MQVLHKKIDVDLATAADTIIKSYVPNGKKKATATQMDANIAIQLNANSSSRVYAKEATVGSYTHPIW